jgi:nicotinamidase-related amidase
LIQIDGKQVLSSLTELVHPARAALILVDLQKDFMDEDGEFARLGIDLSMYPPMRRRLSDLLAAARAAGVLVVHVQMSTLPGRTSDSPAQIRFNMKMHEEFTVDKPPLLYTVVGTRGHEFIEEAMPAPGEIVVPKWRSSGFWGTNLDLVLRSNAVETVVVAGCTTEGCVESTARDAMFNDYYVVVVEDCVASDDAALHEASLVLMRHRFDLANSTELAASWAADPGRPTLNPPDPT